MPQPRGRGRGRAAAPEARGPSPHLCLLNFQASSPTCQGRARGLPCLPGRGGPGGAEVPAPRNPCALPQGKSCRRAPRPSAPVRPPRPPRVQTLAHPRKNWAWLRAGEEGTCLCPGPSAGSWLPGEWGWGGGNPAPGGARSARLHLSGEDTGPSPSLRQTERGEAAKALPLRSQPGVDPWEQPSLLVSERWVHPRGSPEPRGCARLGSQPPR